MTVSHPRFRTHGFPPTVSSPRFPLSGFPPAVSLLKRYVRWSADVIHYDGSDTDSTGTACLPGQGYTHRSGWVDPTGDRTEILPNAVPDLFEAALDGDPTHWLHQRLIARLGAAEDPYDTDSIREPDFRPLTGRPFAVRLTAHPHGFTPSEVASAVEALNTGRPYVHLCHRCGNGPH